MNRSWLLLTALAMSCSVGDCFSHDLDYDSGGREPECDDWQSAFAQLAGYGATDCGGVSAGYDPSTVDACVVSSFESGKPFHAQYLWFDERDTSPPEWGTHAWAGDGDRVFQVEYVADPSYDALSYFECLAPFVPSKDSGDTGDDADQAGLFVLDCGDLGPEQTLCNSRND